MVTLVPSPGALPMQSTAMFFDDLLDRGEPRPVPARFV